MKSNTKNIVLLLLLVAVCIFAAVIITDMVGEKDKFGYSDLVELMEKDQIKSFVLDVEGYISLVTVEGKEHIFRLGYNSQVEYVHDWATSGEHANLESFNFEEPVDTPWIIQYLPYIILFVLMIAFFLTIL